MCAPSVSPRVFFPCRCVPAQSHPTDYWRQWSSPSASDKGVRRCFSLPAPRAQFQIQLMESVPRDCNANETHFPRSLELSAWQGGVRWKAVCWWWWWWGGGSWGLKWGKEYQQGKGWWDGVVGAKTGWGGVLWWAFSPSRKFFKGSARCISLMHISPIGWYDKAIVVFSVWPTLFFSFALMKEINTWIFKIDLSVFLLFIHVPRLSRSFMRYIFTEAQLQRATVVEQVWHSVTLQYIFRISGVLFY